MESQLHSLPALFRQLGLADTPEAIAAFVARQAPLPAHLLLVDAPCWSSAQAELLAQALEDDADWAEVVDELDLLLREPRL